MAYVITGDGVSNGRTSIPIDLANADYRAWLEETNSTHEDVTAAVAAAAQAKADAAAQIHDATLALRVSAAKKLVELGLTADEVRALVGTDPGR